MPDFSTRAGLAVGRRQWSKQAVKTWPKSGIRGVPPRARAIADIASGMQAGPAGRACSEIGHNAGLFPIAVTDGVGTGLAAELFWCCNSSGLRCPGNAAAFFGFGECALCLGRQRALWLRVSHLIRRARWVRGLAGCGGSGSAHGWSSRVVLVASPALITALALGLPVPHISGAKGSCPGDTRSSRVRTGAKTGCQDRVPRSGAKIRHMVDLTSRRCRCR